MGHRKEIFLKTSTCQEYSTILKRFFSPLCEIKVFERADLSIAESKDTEKHESELKRVEKRLADLDNQFLSQLDGLLKRRVLTEEEFAKANESARGEKAELEMRKAELSDLLKQAKATESLVKKIPGAIKTFREAFQSLDIRQQKAQLQTILKSAHVYKDGKIELEFRE